MYFGLDELLHTALCYQNYKWTTFTWQIRVILASFL